MSTGASTRQGRRKQRTAAAILDAAESLFLDAGYQATTVEQIAERADVALGSLYGHFAGKEGVYAALVLRAVDTVERCTDDAWAASGDPVGRLLGVSEAYLRFAREHPGLFRFFRFPPPGVPAGGPMVAAAERVARRVGDEVQRVTEAIEEGLAVGIAPGVEERAALGFEHEPDARAIAVFLWAAWDGVIAAHLLPGNMALSQQEFERVLAVARAVLMRGLLATGAVDVAPR
ncbi:MAG: TetR family transcriptional regulator [Solirubrobacterales bacterium]|nr:TetR family transcriptional regulator [Solirubrobacterales bacterium]